MEIDEGFVVCGQSSYPAGHPVLYKYAEDRWDKQHPQLVLPWKPCALHMDQKVSWS